MIESVDVSKHEQERNEGLKKEKSERERLNGSLGFCGITVEEDDGDGRKETRSRDLKRFRVLKFVCNSK